MISGKYDSLKVVRFLIRPAAPDVYSLCQCILYTSLYSIPLYSISLKYNTYQHSSMSYHNYPHTLPYSAYAYSNQIVGKYGRTFHMTIHFMYIWNYLESLYHRGVSTYGIHYLYRLISNTVIRVQLLTG